MWMWDKQFLIVAEHTINGEYWSIYIYLFAQGRVYQNPDDRHEIWINIGWELSGTQICPEYQPWMSAHITRTTWDRLVGLLMDALDGNPAGDG